MSFCPCIRTWFSICQVHRSFATPTQAWPLRVLWLSGSFRNPNTKRFQEPDNFSITACWSASDKLWSSTRPPSLILSVVEIFHGTLIRLRSCEEQKFDAKYPFYHWFQQCLPFQRWGEMGVSSWFHRLTTKQHVQIVSKIVQFVELTNLRILIWSKGLGMRQKTWLSATISPSWSARSPLL